MTTDDRKPPRETQRGPSRTDPFRHGLHPSQDAFGFFVQTHILDLSGLRGGKCEHAMVNVEIGPPGRKLFRLAQAREDCEPSPRSIGRPELLQES